MTHNQARKIGIGRLAYLAKWAGAFKESEKLYFEAAMDAEARGRIDLFQLFIEECIISIESQLLADQEKVEKIDRLASKILDKVGEKKIPPTLWKAIKRTGTMEKIERHRPLIDEENLNHERQKDEGATRDIFYVDNRYCQILTIGPNCELRSYNPEAFLIEYDVIRRLSSRVAPEKLEPNIDPWSKREIYPRIFLFVYEGFNFIVSVDGAIAAIGSTSQAEALKEAFLRFLREYEVK